jgi:hypothetical protein
MKISVKRLTGATILILGLLFPAMSSANETDTGRWSDEINYIRSHGVSVIQNGNGSALIVLETKFGPGGAPVMRLHLGKDGVANPSADLGVLSKIKGLQVFETPAAVDISDFNELHIWNADDGTSLGVAPLGGSSNP